MTKAIMKITAVLFGVVAGFATIPAATASADSLRGGGKSFVGPVDDPFFVDLG
jgi:hypothetical protein